MGTKVRYSQELDEAPPALSALMQVWPGSFTENALSRSRQWGRCRRP
jgi:hypothetical protein